MERTLRENSRLARDGWSDWVRAIVPTPENWDSQHYTVRSSGQEGLMYTNITDAALPDKMDKCGIYEWRAERKSDKQRKVVYVGSTCRAKRGSLRARVLEYCTNGSHKKDLINEALRNGYELHVHVKTSGDDSDSEEAAKEAAEEMENKLLDTYNYAWNVRKNGIRDVLNCTWTVT